MLLGELPRGFCILKPFFKTQIKHENDFVSCNAQLNVFFILASLLWGKSTGHQLVYLFIFRSTDSHICIIRLLIPKLVPKVTELAEVSLSTPSLRLKYARDSFKVWTSLLKLQY